MLNISNYYDKYLIYAKYFFILFLYWLSINTGSKYVKIDNFFLNVTEQTFNFLRSILPYGILIYLLAFTKKNKVKVDYFFIFFGLYGFIQILGLVYQLENLYEHYWIVCLFSVLLFYNFLINEKNTNLINFILCSNIFLILTIFLIFIFITFKENLLSNYLLYNSQAFSIVYNTEQFPRSSGLSRMALILFIFINSLYLSKISFLKKNTYLLISNTFLVSIILLLQSRTVILFFLLFFLFLLIIFKIENKFKYFIFIIILPILIFISYPNLKNFLIEKYGTKDTHTSSQKNIKLKNIEIKLRSNLLLLEEDEDKSVAKKFASISNNRVDAWQFLLQMFFNNKLNDDMKNRLIKAGYDPQYFKKILKKNLLTGYGPQADRQMMYNKSKIDEAPAILGPFGYNASNGIIYSLICSGIIGLVCFIAVNLIILFKSLKLFIYYMKSKNFNSHPILVTSIFSVLFLQFRSLFENSFSVYGVDLLILVTSYLVIQNEYRKLQN